MAEIIARSGNELTIQVTIKLTGSLLALLNKSKFGQSHQFLVLVRFLRTQAYPDLSLC